ELTSRRVNCQSRLVKENRCTLYLAEELRDGRLALSWATADEPCRRPNWMPSPGRQITRNLLSDWRRRVNFCRRTRQCLEYAPFESGGVTSEWKVHEQAVNAWSA